MVDQNQSLPQSSPSNPKQRQAKTLKKFFIVGLVAVAAVAIFVAMSFGEKSPIYAAGDVTLDPSLASAATGIRTLFIILHDEQSAMPMPMGASRVKLYKDAEGQFYTFVLTKESMQMMGRTMGGDNGGDNASPKTIRLKARLDTDGSAGMDQPGDLVGEVSGVPFGATGIHIKIDRAIP